MNIRLLFLVLNVDPSKKNPSVQILLSILNQPFNKKGKSIIFFHIKAATRRYSRLDINVTHHLACDRLLLEQNVSCIPDDQTQLISIGTKHREKIQQTEIDESDLKVIFETPALIFFGRVSLGKSSFEIYFSSLSSSIILQLITY